MAVRRTWTLLTSVTIRRQPTHRVRKPNFLPMGNGSPSPELRRRPEKTLKCMYADSLTQAGASRYPIMAARDWRWRADGKELFYVAIDKKLMAVSIDTSHDEPVAGVPHVSFPDAHRRGAYRRIPIRRLPRWQPFPNQTRCPMSEPLP